VKPFADYVSLHYPRRLGGTVVRGFSDDFGWIWLTVRNCCGDVFRLFCIEVLNFARATFVCSVAEKTVSFETAPA
jgi:hypothetical protein